MSLSLATKRLRRMIAPGLLAAALIAPLPAFAQDEAATAAPAPSESAMVNLVRALVAQGVLKPEQGEVLIQQAEAEAGQARAARSAQETALRAPAPGTVRVPYIPETVRAQIKEELRTEVLAEARSGGWAAPDAAAPEWTKRITLHGDIRVRSQSDLYSKTNADDIIDFATINAIGPYGIDDPRLLLPILNSRNDQWNRTRLRARLGVDVKVAEGVTAGIAIATGDNSGPISTNASLGGGFFKRDLWLDKAWVRLAPTDWASATLGRMDNPYRSSDLLYDRDLNLDGVVFAVDSDRWLGDAFKVTARGGAFPIEYGASNYPNFAFDKQSVPTKYLFAAELEASGSFEDLKFSLAAGYHRFTGFQGDLSTPCQVEVASFCSTDFLQPLFLTKGNTLSPLRRIVVVNPNADTPQLLGYSFAYRVLDANASVSIPIGETTLAQLSGSFVKNLAFDAADICRNGPAGRPYNNNDSSGGTYCATTNPAQFVGGDTGYRGQILVGHAEPFETGQWQVFAGYRYLESDAVLDAFTDSDFHLGGTNSKGYFIGGGYALRKGVLIAGKWMSANEISGPPLAIDVLQVDLNIEF